MREKIDGAGERGQTVHEREDRRCRRERIDGAGERTDGAGERRDKRCRREVRKCRREIG